MQGNGGKITEYLRILDKCGGLSEAARSLYEKYRGDVLAENTVLVTAPVIYMYACHVLDEAQRHGIKKLYFLARDGYSVMRAARVIAERLDIPVEIRYFYCSRYSLRMAAYRFMDDSAFDRLFYESYDLSAKGLLLRAGFDDDERSQVYEDTGYSFENESAPMDREAFRRLCGKVRASQVFLDILKRRSDSAYESTMAYIRQEGIADGQPIGIVDLGWTGSMQHTLKRLLMSAGIEKSITGYYVGMLETPPSDEGSRYDCWLFEGRGDALTRSWFSHNLMECICTAPHGMTMRYEKKDGIYAPVLADCENDADRVKRLSDIMEEFAGLASGKLGYDRRYSLQLLKMLMYRPSQEEAEAFGSGMFCDDVTEGYHKSMTEAVGKEELSARLLHRRLIDKITKKKNVAGGLYWYYGSLALSKVRTKGLYRVMYRCSECVRYIILGIKNRR